MWAKRAKATCAGCGTSLKIRNGARGFIACWPWMARARTRSSPKRWAAAASRCPSADRAGTPGATLARPIPIVLLARVIERLSRIALPNNPRTTVNVGIIEGGTSVNAIPESALMRVDLRSTDPARIAAVEAQLQAILKEVVDGAGNPSGVQSRVRVIGDRPAAELNDGAFILEALRAVDSQLGIKSHVHCASTDANIPLSLGLQALAIGAGGTGARAHTLQEWFIARGRDRRAQAHSVDRAHPGRPGGVSALQIF